MYIDRYVYNTLSRFVRRIKMQISTVMVSVGAMGVLGGMTIMLGDPLNRLMGGIIGLLGLVVCVGAYIKVLSDDRKELDRQRNEMEYTERMSSGIETMSAGIKTMSRNISNLVEEIRKDRNQREKEGNAKKCQ